MTMRAAPAAVFSRQGSCSLGTHVGQQPEQRWRRYIARASVSDDVGVCLDGANGSMTVEASSKPSNSLYRAIWGRAGKVASYQLEKEVFGVAATVSSADVRQARSCKEVQELLKAAETSAGSLDPTIAATALSTLPKLMRKARMQSDADRAEVNNIVQHAVSQSLLPGIEQLSADSLVSSAVGLAKLGYNDHQAFQAIASSSVKHMKNGSMSGQGLAKLAWALATAGVRPYGAWLSVFWTKLEEHMDELTAQDIANIFWSICRLELMPPWISGSMPELLATALKRVGPAETGQDPATVMVCLAIWSRSFSYHPPEHLLNQFLAAMQPNLNRFLSQDLVSIVHSLVVMNASPSRAWMTDFYVVLRDRLIFDPTLSYSDFQRLLWALSRIDYVPSQAWLKHFVEASIVKLQHLRFRGLTELVWALACWGYTPTKEWLREYFRVTHAKLHEFRPQHLANAILALKKLGCKVPSFWLDAALVSFCAKLPETKAHDLVTFIDGIVDVCEDAAWMSRPATGQRLRSLADYAASKFDICDCVMHAKLLVALATARICPSAAWLSAQQDSLAKSLLQEQTGSFDTELAGSVRRAYASLDVPLSPSLAQELELKSN